MSGNRRGIIFIVLPFLIGIAFVYGFSLLLGWQGYSVVLSAAGEVSSVARYVATTGSDSANDCSSSAAPCASIQQAVDQASSGDEVRVAAGNYSGSQVVTHTDSYTYTQVVFIDQDLSLQGGYSTSNWNSASSSANPTIIDAGGHGRGITVIDAPSNKVSIGGFTITGGDYTGLGNPVGVPSLVCRSWAVGCGGGLYVKNSQVQLKDLIISNNNAGNLNSEGGGIYLWSARDVEMESVTVVNNTAIAGGGLSVTEQYYPLTIVRSTFDGNVADQGGGIYLKSNIENLVTIEQSTIVNNIADSWDGGGISARLTEDGLVLYMDRVMFQGNQAAGLGMAVYLDSAGPHTPSALFTNLILANNQRVAGTPETDEDATIAVVPNFTNFILDMMHVTAADSPVKNFLYAQPDTDPGKFITLTLTNTLLSGYKNAFTAKEVISGEVTLQHNYSMLHNVGNMHLSLGGTPTFTATNLVTGDPKLKGNYHLSEGSDAINAGVDTGLPMDIDGNERPSGSSPDVGADEYVQIYIYLPFLSK